MVSSNFLVANSFWVATDYSEYFNFALFIIMWDTVPLHLTLGTLWNYIGDGNRNIYLKHKRVFWAKQQLCMCITCFVHFFAIPAQLQCEMTEFYSWLKNGDSYVINFIFSLWTRMHSFLFSSSYLPYFQVTGGLGTMYKGEIVSNDTKPFLQGRFHWCHHCQITKVPNWWRRDTFDGVCCCRVEVFSLQSSFLRPRVFTCNCSHIPVVHIFPASFTRSLSPFWVPDLNITIKTNFHLEVSWLSCFL